MCLNKEESTQQLIARKYGPIFDKLFSEDKKLPETVKKRKLNKKDLILIDDAISAYEFMLIKDNSNNTLLKNKLTELSIVVRYLMKNKEK